MKGYLVSQPLDRVRILEAGRYAGLLGVVADEKAHEGHSVTGRDCLVRFEDDLGGGTRWFHADNLEVVGRPARSSPHPETPE